MPGLEYYGDKFKWFVGVCKELSSDGTKIKVRVFGIHRMDDVTDVSDGDLPEAVVLMPTTAGEGSNSNMQMGIKEGDMVMGFFADGDDCQQPIVIGVVGGGWGSTATSNPDDPDYSTDGGSGDGGDTGGGGDDGMDGGADITVPGNGREEQAYNFLRSKFESWSGNAGDPHIQAVAVMGHIKAESGWDITAHNTRGENSRGLIQWDSTRWGRMTEHGKYPATFMRQLSFIFWEMEHTHPKAKAALMRAKSLHEAVTALSVHYVKHWGVYGGKLFEDVCNGKARMPVGRSKGKVNNGGCSNRRKYAHGYDNAFRNRYTRPEENGSAQQTTAPEQPPSDEPLYWENN